MLNQEDLIKKVKSYNKFFNPEKYHLSLEIESNYLRSLNKIQAQRKIMKILAKELEAKIHALEIKIK